MKLYVHKVLKNKHEESVANTFIKLYNPRFKFLKHGNDITEPDCIFKYENEILGIEVVSVYYSNEFAEKEWELARKNLSLKDFSSDSGEVMVDFTKSFLERLQKEINKKCEKIYTSTDKTILCIEERNPLSEKKDVDYFISKIVIPQNNNFSEIYFLHLSPSHEGGTYKKFKIK